MALTLAVFIAGGLGALTRFGVDSAVVRWWKGRSRQVWGDFPAGTFVINITGAAVLGLITGWVTANATPLAHDVSTIAGTGFLGAYTTFSTEQWQELGLLREKALAEAIAMGASLIVSLLLAGLGLWIGAKL